jgi:hypothetical protein
MGYKQKATLKIELGDLGDNNGTPFFVTIKNPAMMTFDETLDMAKMSKLQEMDRRALTDDEKKELHGFLQGLIQSWNLLDKDTEQPLDPHSEGALNRVPREVVLRIFQTFGDSRKPDEPTKNSSEQSAKS